MNKDIKKEIHEAVFAEFPELTEEQKEKMKARWVNPFTVEDFHQTYCGLPAGPEIIAMMYEECCRLSGRWREPTEEEWEALCKEANFYHIVTKTGEMPDWKESKAARDRIMERLKPIL